jgi:hypothetical protein
VSDIEGKIKLEQQICKKIFQLDKREIIGKQPRDYACNNSRAAPQQ